MLRMGLVWYEVLDYLHVLWKLLFRLLFQFFEKAFVDDSVMRLSCGQGHCCSCASLWHWLVVLVCLEGLRLAKLSTHPPRLLLSQLLLIYCHCFLSRWARNCNWQVLFVLLEHLLEHLICDMVTFAILSVFVLAHVWFEYVVRFFEVLITEYIAVVVIIDVVSAHFCLLFLT